MEEDRHVVRVNDSTREREFADDELFEKVPMLIQQPYRFRPQQPLMYVGSELDHCFLFELELLRKSLVEHDLSLLKPFDIQIDRSEEVPRESKPSRGTVTRSKHHYSSE
jgi:hypothetical protein